MPAGQHREGYRRPGKGQKRKKDQPFLLDRLPQEVRNAILEARKDGKTWEETAESASQVAGQPVSETGCRRWYDVRVAQVLDEARAQDRAAQKALDIFKGRTFDDLPESSVHALKKEVFGVMDARTQEDKEKSIGNFLFLLAKVIDAQSKQKRAEIEERKVNLAQKKFEELKQKAAKALNEAEAKLGKGKEVTLADINRIRERFGLPPADPGAATGR